MIQNFIEFTAGLFFGLTIISPVFPGLFWTPFFYIGTLLLLSGAIIVDLNNPNYDKD